jgi:hypothetical protein
MRVFDSNDTRSPVNMPRILVQTQRKRERQAQRRDAWLRNDIISYNLSVHVFVYQRWLPSAFRHQMVGSLYKMRYLESICLAPGLTRNVICSLRTNGNMEMKKYFVINMQG